MEKKRKNSLNFRLKKIFLLTIVLVFTLTLFFIIQPKKTNSASLTSASATLGNSRLSFRAGINGNHSAGSPTITIDNTDADQDTKHLFPNDVVCFPDAGFNGCKGNTSYTVTNIYNDSIFHITPSLATGLVDSDYVVATQSGSLTIQFTTSSEIPANGSILVTIPAVNENGKTCDGFPDYANTLENNGFDLKGISASDITVTGCSWNATETITCGNATSDHTIAINATATCPANSQITITIDSSPGIINPAPINTSRGIAEIYTLNVKTRDSNGYTLDEIDIPIGVIESVLVSASVEEYLSLQVQGISADSGTYCGVTRTGASPDSTAYSVPFGTISTTYNPATHNAVQQLTVSTNADGGYKVYVEENDQMGKDGITCPGTAPSIGDYTFISATCIRDTVCNSSGCSHTTYQDWEAAGVDNYPGLGYSLENVGSDTDAKFEYSDGGATWNAKQFADVQGGENPFETNAEIMINTNPVDNSDVYVCFRIDVPGTQPAGYYFNKISYTAVPTF